MTPVQSGGKTIDQNYLLNQNNQFRSKEGLGPASWNQAEFCSARCSVKRCTNFPTDKAHDSGPYSQNIAWVDYGQQQFYEEKSNSGCTMHNIDACGHYVNMMTQSTVGCNFQSCTGKGTMNGGYEMRCNYN